MRNASWWLASTLALAAIGCSGGGTITPAVSPDTNGVNLPGPAGSSSYNGSAEIGQALQQSDISQSALAIYTVSVDSQTLSATAALKQLRHGADNDDLYLLGIDSFLKPTSFTVTGVGGDADSIDLGWQFAHPFPACSDPAGTPNGSTNRADLGVAAALLFLNDVPAAAGNTYFTDRVANTALVMNADCYYSPGNLVTTTGMLANTFPLQMVANEATDNRAGVSNGAVVTGNFGPDGWTRSELGANKDGWTGYGIIHQGQTTKGTVELSRAELLTSGFSFDVAVIAKYNDPRGGANAAAKKANRLPPATADTTKFAYRMPHGSFDCSGVALNNVNGVFLDDAVSAATLTFNVVDWDARATETTSPALKDDTDPTHVAVGEAGLPDFSVCIPDVLGDATVVDDYDSLTDVLDDDSAFGGDVAADSGQPGDALCYSKSVTETVLTGQTPGTYTGMARATDPEIANITDPFFVIELDGSLAPLTTGIPTPTTYAAFTVDLESANEPPTATVTGPVAPVAAGTGVLTLTVNPYNDPDADPMQIQFDWNNDGDYADTGEALQALDGTPPDTFNSPIFYTNPGSTCLTKTVPFGYTDGVIPTPITGTVNFTLLPGNPGLNFAGTPISGFWSLTGANIWTVNGQTLPAWDFATWPGGASLPPGVNGSGGVVAQVRGVAAPDLAFASWVTTSGTINSNLAVSTGLLNSVHQLEVDRTGRIVYATTGAGFTPANSLLDLQSLYTTGAQPNFSWFNYSGGAVAFGTHNVVSTTGAKVIALALDQSDNVYVIDETHKLHKYLKASAYAEDTGCVFPINLAPIIGSNGGVTAGDTNRKVADFIVDFRNNCFFIMVVSRSAAPNVRVYRIEGNGNFNASVEGNANPALFDMGNGDTTQNQPYDITIDQLDTTGAVLATQGEAQINCVTSGGTNEVFYLNSKMQQYFAYNVFGAVECHRTIMLNNWPVANYNGVPNTWLVYSGTPPAGTQ